jgi:hypothetical protein
MPHGYGYYYIARVDSDRRTFWHWLSKPEATADQFMSRFQAGKRPRMWPELKEDSLLYRGISAWLSGGKAIEEAQAANRGYLAGGRPRRWTHVVEFTVDGHDGQVFAEEGPRDHFSVWGEPADLASSAGVPVPIPPE